MKGQISNLKGKGVKLLENWGKIEQNFDQNNKDFIIYCGRPTPALLKNNGTVRKIKKR